MHTMYHDDVMYSKVREIDYTQLPVYSYTYKLFNKHFHVLKHN